MSKNTALLIFAICLLLCGCVAIFFGLFDPSNGMPLDGIQKTYLLWGGAFAVVYSLMLIEDLK